MISLLIHTEHSLESITKKITARQVQYNTAENPSEFNVDEKLIKDNNWDELNELFKDILL